jgi:hypothetical protein
MAIGTALNIAGGITASVGKAFGLNTWQLQDGTFNGVTFCSPSRSDLPILSSGAIGGILSAADGIQANINSFSGKPASNTNSRISLIDTTLNILSMKSDFILQNVTKQFPYANESMVEKLGSGGFLHSFIIQVVGQDYLTAINNLKNAIINPPDNSSNGILVHPSLGRISGQSSVVNFNYVESFNLWRGATLFISFMSPNESMAINPSKSLAQNIFNAATSCLAAVKSITTAFTVLKGYYTEIENLISPQTKNSQLNKISVGVSLATNKLNAATNYIVKTSNSGAQISALTNTPLDTSALPVILNGVEIPAINSVTKTYNSNQGEIIIQDYSGYITSFVTEIQAIGGLTNSLSVELIKSISTLANLAIAAGVTTPTKTFTTPYVMSLSKVLHINGININLMDEVFKNNPQLNSANYIAQGSKVFL